MPLPARKHAHRGKTSFSGIIDITSHGADIFSRDSFFKADPRFANAPAGAASGITAGAGRAE